MWAYAALLLVASLAVDLTSGQVCGDHTVWRNSNRTCPPRAVCADVFDTVRNWYDGRTCEERRTLHNCFCQSGAACPVDNDDHRMYASQYHRIYTCEPICQLPWCANIPSTSPHGPVAFTTEQQSPDFYGYTFHRVDCRCPRHHVASSGNGILHHSVRTVGTTYNARSHNYQTRHACRNSASDSQRADPCAAA